jgi:hypothetical protein
VTASVTVGTAALRLATPGALTETESAGLTGPGCEAIADGFLREPVSAVSSLAYVVAAVLVLALARGRRTPPRAVPVYAALVAGIGVGSVVQHGPDPAWADLAHDLPLVATLCLVAADGVAALRGRDRSWWWWVAPTAALVPAIVLVPRPADVAQAVVAAVAVVVTLLRVRRTPAARPRVLVAVGLLGVGAAVGTLSRAGGPLCDPTSLWQGHAVWHVLSAAALVVLAPVLTGAGSPSAAGRNRLSPRPGPPSGRAPTGG